MAVFSEIAQLIPTLDGRVGDVRDLDGLRGIMQRMSDAEIVSILEETSDASQRIDQIALVASGIIANRSKRHAGHRGLAQSRGHASATSLVQRLTGSTKAEASRQLRVGEQLVADGQDAADGTAEGVGAAGGNAGGLDAGGADAGEDASLDGDANPGGMGSTTASSALARDWRAPLRKALGDGRLTPAQFDAIDGGLGEPPRAPERPAGAGESIGDDDETGRERDAEFVAAWRQAAEQLVDEARERTVEELRAAARSIRDLLDPEGARQRFLARFEKRAFRTWIDRDGQRRASVAFDDEGGAFYDSVIAAALRPRRGGPRFVDPDEQQAAQELIDDPRTNDQLAYDLFIDLIRAGALADSASVMGARQAGVRLVRKVAGDGRPAPVALTEDGLAALPGESAEQRACDSGTVQITIDERGKPLDVGRERRLFTSRQRIALAARDGGCRWPGCDRPASYCEAHHMDAWADGGRTDVERGILLCRFHHMNLHHHDWSIRSGPDGEPVLVDPGGRVHRLRERAVLRYAWGDLAPPETRFRAA